MRKTTLLQRIISILGISALTILLLACPEELKEINFEKRQDKAQVTFKVADISARTVLPQVSLEDVNRYTLLGGKNGEEETTLVESFYGTGISVSLEPGTWNFTLNAYNGGYYSPSLILQGKVQNKQINLTGTNEVSFSLSVLNDDTGSIRITLNFPKDAGITKISAGGDVTSQDFTSGDFTSGSTSTTTRFTYTKNNINAGDYFVTFKIYRGDILRRTVSELVLVRKNLTSSKTITLEGEDLRPLLTGTVSIPASAVVNQVLTAGTADLNGTGEISYQWKRGAADIVDANADTYMVQTDDVGSRITVVVTRDGYLGSVTSLSTTNVPALITRTLNSVTADGNATQATTILTLNFSGTITDLAADDITLTHSLGQVFVKGVPTVPPGYSTYTLPISGFFSDGTVSVAVSKPGYIINGSPKTDIQIYCYSLTLIGTVSISGTFSTGQTLTAVTTNLGGNGAITYQWRRGTTVVGTNSSTYTVVAADIGTTFTLRVTRAGYDGYIDSPPVLPALTGSVSIVGNTQAAQTLTANTTYLNGSGDISYQWKRGGTTNIGTNSNTYTLQSEDIGSTISVTVTRSGNSGSVTSASTPAIALPSLTGTVSITGTTRVGQTLTANTASLGGSGAISYQWKKNGSTISGATSSTYVLQFADAGSTMSVTVTRAGTTGSITSLSTTVIMLPTITETILPFSVTLSDRQITTANATNRYAVVLGMPGTLTLKLTSSGVGSALPNNGADVKWYNVSNTQLGTTGAVLFPYEESKTLAAGIYYIEVIGRSGAGNTGLYNIRVDYYNDEAEPNNTIANAQTLISGLTVKGTLNSSDIDMYKYVLAEPGRLTVNADKGTLSYMRVRWYDANGTEIRNSLLNSSYDWPYNEYMDLETGTYYIGIEQYSGSTGTYNLRGDFIAAENNEIEPNNTRQNAQSVTSGQTVKGFISYKDSIDMYQMNLAQPGRLRVNVAKGTISYIRVRWYNASGTEIRNSLLNSSYDWPYNEYMDLETGTYCISIEQYSGSTGTYDIRNDFTAAGNNETEPNNTRQTAQPVTSGQAVKGFISYQDSIDMYQINLTQPGRLTVNAAKGTISYIRVRWYDASGTEIRNSLLNSSYDWPYNEYMDLETGIYCISIEQYSNSTGTYDINADFTAAGNNETEPNNTRQTAQPVTSGQAVKGFISYQDDTDVYKCVLSQPGKLTVNAAKSTISYIRVRWYDANGTEIRNSLLNSSYDWPYNQSMDLAAGTYYISIEKYSGSTGTYNLTATW